MIKEVLFKKSGVTRSWRADRRKRCWKQERRVKMLKPPSTCEVMRSL